MAAPFVNGAAALIKSKNLSLTPQEIRGVLAHNAIDMETLVGIEYIDSDWCMVNIWLCKKKHFLNKETLPILERLRMAGTGRIINLQKI